MKVFFPNFIFPAILSRTMEVHKLFLQRLLKLTYSNAFIILKEDIVPQLSSFVQYMTTIKYEDGMYHTFYGELKKVISAFLSYYTETINDIVIETDKCCNDITQKELLLLTQRTIDINYDRQIFFSKTFLPVCNAVEKEAYEEIEKVFEQYVPRLHELRDNIEKFDKQDKVDNFSKEHFPLSLMKTSEIFDFAHVFIALMLADRLKEIRVSLEEVLLRSKNNLKEIQENRRNDMLKLLTELYDRNKEYLQITRQQRKCSIETAEVSHSIQKLHNKIGEYKYMHALQRVQEEMNYWETQLKRFNQIADELLKLKAAQENVTREEQIYNSRRTTELPGSKKSCWLAMGENFQKRQVFLKEKTVEVARTLMTIFSSRGADRVIYKNDVGKYFIDEFNHEVYTFNNGMNLYHITCDGDFIEVDESKKHFFDVNGRYIKGENDETVYQCAPCTSSYKLGEDNLLKKLTKDCGHSDSNNKTCNLQCNWAATITEILPDVEPKDIKGTLDPEVVKYLWSSFGHILPEALNDVGIAQPHNPIHYIAHKILLHKYNKTFADFWKRKREAEEYRAQVFKERKEEAMKASKAWKAKQTKHRKPEESDDAETRAAFDAQKVAHENLLSLNYYYN